MGGYWSAVGELCVLPEIKGEDRSVIGYLETFRNGTFEGPLSNQFALSGRFQLLRDQRFVQVRGCVVTAKASELHRLDVVDVAVVGDHDFRPLFQRYLRWLTCDDRKAEKQQARQHTHCKTGL